MENKEEEDKKEQKNKKNRKKEQREKKGKKEAKVKKEEKKKFCPKGKLDTFEVWCRGRALFTENSTKGSTRTRPRTQAHTPQPRPYICTQSLSGVTHTGI